ncbi:hypothetical protein DFW101_2352 [Solidesulfovibrio carbinoliphilus subsp. oakridgensis]|uniref:Periplasmic heavy metal sensor n=1 Tax=Solidesulfovibrio carbinoliphilus subsp. oakridgensis TaxID=694327 RepID=G7QB15_9BACT|nr:hypothetical protein [Solidesulfovibrio carbinoliphilus]EHJ48356.1 hypothetical protein DFW101_2352 [Solidesulfovibrio carbinoliphilus subsp. oakridgensis]
MNPTVTKIMAGLVLFASGTVMGFFGARFLAERGRLALLHGDPRQFSEMVVRRLSDDLDLTKAQREKLRPIIRKTSERMIEIRREQEPKVREAIENSITETKAILTPEQREKFTALMERLQERRRALERFGPPPPPPGFGGFPPPPPGMAGGPPPPGFEGYPPLPPEYGRMPPPAPGSRPPQASPAPDAEAPDAAKTPGETRQ